MVSWSWDRAKQRVRSGVSKAREKVSETAKDMKAEARFRADTYVKEKKRLDWVRREAEWDERVKAEKRKAKEKYNPSPVRSTRKGKGKGTTDARPASSRDLGSAVFGESSGWDSFLGTSEPEPRGSSRASRERGLPRESGPMDIIGGPSDFDINNYVHGSESGPGFDLDSYLRGSGSRRRR